MRILVTGAAGYVGSVLAERFAELPSVRHVIATDRHPRHESGAVEHDKIEERTGLLEDAEFVERFADGEPIDAIVHAAFAVRAGYGRQAKVVEHGNIEGCRNVFSFAFRHRIPRLIYFSSAAVYGARPGNKAEQYFSEDQPLREDSYPYGAQKKATEEILESMYAESDKETQVAIVRPCGITGPRFLSEPTKKISLVAFLKDFLPVIPEVSPEWARQYIHEDDVYKAVRLLLETDLGQNVESFNLAPHDHLTAKDIARVLGKRTVRLPAWLVNAAFSVIWHGTRGRVPTPKGSIAFYQYPINLDGRKITRLGFEYSCSSEECLLTA